MHSKYGEVMSLRLPPADILACIDIIDAIGAYQDGMSLSAAVRIAISSAMETLRQSGTIPRRDGFEYSQMVQRFAVQSRSKRATVALAVRQAEVNLSVADTSRKHLDIPTKSVLDSPARTQGEEDLFDELVVQKGRLITQQQELQFKRSADPVNFSPAEVKELDDTMQRIAEIDRQLDRLSQV